MLVEAILLNVNCEGLDVPCVTPGRQALRASAFPSMTTGLLLHWRPTIPGHLPRRQAQGKASFYKARDQTACNPAHTQIGLTILLVLSPTLPLALVCKVQRRLCQPAATSPTCWGLGRKQKKKRNEREDFLLKLAAANQKSQKNPSTIPTSKREGLLPSEKARKR